MSNSSTPNKTLTADELPSRIQGLNVDQMRKLHHEVLNQASTITRHTILSNGMTAGDYTLLWIRSISSKTRDINAFTTMRLIR